MQCPYCQSADTFTFFSAEMPNLLAACPESMLARVKSRPFQASLCRDCALGFNSSPLAAEELKEIYDDYLYISPLNGIGRTKYPGMIRTLQETYHASDRIVEIGCSEGYLLSHLRDLGYTNLTGVEPAPQAATAAALGFHVIRDYFRNGMFDAQSVDGFYLMHVFEHLPDPFEVLAEMKRALSSSGAIVIEVPNLEGFVHQHLFFFSMPFMRRLCGDLGLKIVRAETDELILRVVLAGRTDARPEQPASGEATRDAVVAGAEVLYRRFVEQIERVNGIFRASNGRTVYWWGAGSTGVVYLNQLDPSLRQTTPVVVVDGDKSKWGCYVPGPSVPVRSFQELRGQDIDCLVIASQFENEIREAARQIGLRPKRIEVFTS